MITIHRLLFLFCFLIFGSVSAQQITGQVKDADTQLPIPGATVQIKNTEQGTVTDMDGNFSISGSGTLEISYLGYKTESVNPGNTFVLIYLKPENFALDAVELVGRKAQTYTSDYSFSATRTSTLNKDIPQAISTVTKELIDEQQGIQLADAVKNVSGVSPTSFYNQYSIRGISQNEEGQLINGMRTRQFYFLQPLLANVERVEVLKGPASATFSSVDPGGSINLVTKKPLDVARNEVKFTTGSFSNIMAAADFTGPLNEEKTLLYRFNGAYREVNSYRDNINNTSLLLSPSFTYLAGDQTALNVELIYSDMKGKLDRGQPIFGAEAGVTDLNSTPISLNLGAPNDFFNSKQFIITGNLTHQFSDQIGFTTTYMKQTWKEDLQERRTTNGFGVDLENNPVPTLAAMRFIQRQQSWSVDNVNSYFNFEFNTGALKHKLLLGYDLHSWAKLKGGGQNQARGYLLNDGSATNAFDPTNAGAYQTYTYEGMILPRPNVPHYNLEDPNNTLNNLTDYNFNGRTAFPTALTETHAAYLQEQLEYRGFHLLFSLRQEWFRDITNPDETDEVSFTNRALLPRIGLTYTVNDRINVYGTYLEGFQPQSNTVTIMPNTESFYGSTDDSASRFKPLESDLKEVGAKITLLKNKLHINTALYEINQRNLLLNANIPSAPDSLVTRGAERSRGFEVDVTGYLVPNWQVYGSFSYNDAEIIQDNDPDLIGARKQNSPITTANLWTRYNFLSTSKLHGLGLGFGAQHSGDKVPTYDRNFKTPAYTLFDLAVYFSPRNSNIQLNIAVKNLTDKTYWIGAQNYLRLFPGAPRNFLATATYTF